MSDPDPHGEANMSVVSKSQTHDLWENAKKKRVGEGRNLSPLVCLVFHRMLHHGKMNLQPLYIAPETYIITSN